MSGTASLQPTYFGHVSTTQDALVLFEACLTGHLSHVPRRPHDRERNHLIRSGSVFIYEENASGIKRWTDGVTWSPSRILGNFLVYRELDKPFPPGEKKRAMKKNKRLPRPGEPYARPDDAQYSPVMANQNFNNDGRQPSEMERSLIGSLIDSYGFKENGLVKKTMSVTVQGVTHHLVSYYNVSEVLAQGLPVPTQDEKLKFVRPRIELTTKQSFRSPLEEADDALDGGRDAQSGYGYRPGMMGGPGYQMGGPGAFYPQNTQYPPNNFYPPSSTGGYGVGVPAHNYLGQAVSNPPFKTEHDSFSNPSPYSRGYDSGMSGPNPAGSVPPSMNSITSTSQASHPSMYGQANMPSRPSTGLDSRGGQPYNRTSYGNGQSQSMDNRRSMQPSPAHNGERRDAQPMQQSVYPAGNDRQQYYNMNGSGSSLSHSHYPSSAPVPSWSGGPAAQPQM